jgi:glycosyltransferase involved in cell wall biosynthesis
VKVSVVVPAFNEEKLIGQTLWKIKEACGALHELAWDTELIVCDNNSSDATAAIAREEGAHVVFEPVNQISRSRNAGAAAATGDWLIFVDADSQPSRELFGDVGAAISSGRYIAGGATVELDAYSRGSRLVVRTWNSLSRMARLMAGSFIFCERVAFEAVGGFSRELFAKEEIDLSQKLKRFGRKRNKKLIILHRHPLLTSSRKMRLYSRGELLGFFVRNAFSGGRDLKSAETCFPWYDGRR